MGGQEKRRALRLMTGQFDSFPTIDGNLQYQQNLAQVKITVIVLSASNNKFETLKPLMPHVLAALPTMEPGQIIAIHEGREEE